MERKPFLLRISPEIWEAVERLAQAELRSVNGQIEYLLRDALAQRGLIHSPGASSSGGFTRRNSRQRSKS